jgi:hypothetical protein
MNQLDKIYKELGQKICLYPFFGSFYETFNIISESDKVSNSVRPCSLVPLYPNQNRVWDIETNIRDTRNNPTWQRIRRMLVDGKFDNIKECQVCTNNEALGLSSPRIENNKFYTEFLNIDIVDKVKKIIANNNRATDVYSLDYYPSNYCNYSCIMCSGGASSQRLAYEVNLTNLKRKLVLNNVDDDFYDILSTVEIINFTGGETLLQTQIHNLIDYLIKNNLSKNITITLLTNASSYPLVLIEKFKLFKNVIYTISVDGVGDVIEYQRRGAKWATVEETCLKIVGTPKISAVINYVLTAVNVFSFMDFIDWLCTTNLIHTNKIYLSPVFKTEHLGLGALDQGQRDVVLNRLQAGKQKYSSELKCVDMIDQIVNIINTTPFNQEYQTEFVEYIRNEDAVSKKKLTDVVPEWAPYF